MSTGTDFSDKELSSKQEASKQMGTVGNRGFSGTRLRLGQETRSRRDSSSMPRSRWVTGAGLKYPAKKRIPGRAVSPHKATGGNDR